MSEERPGSKTKPATTYATVALPSTVGSDDNASTLEESEAVSLTHLGHYRILGVLGRGGMGVVYEAYDARLDRKVAIKRLRTQGSSEQPRFVREAMAMAKLSHPNVIPIYEIGEHDHATYIVMEYVEGTTLRDWQTRPRSLSELLTTFKGAARGLIAAHGKGLVHRDFKPDNVMIGKDGRVRVMDFGLARAAGHDSDGVDSDAPTMTEEHSEMSPAFDALTKTGVLLGTPAYMSPEQHRGMIAGPASDQFSFCVAFYEALYGERPFSGNTMAELRHNLELGRVREPPADTTVPTWLRGLLCRGLAPKPEDRFASMQGLFDELLAGELAHETDTRKPAGFRVGRAKQIWQRLLAPIANGKVVPIIGPRLLEAAHGSSHDTAKRLADANRYPMALHEWDDLPRVTAYLSVKESRYNVVQAFQEQLLRNLLAQHGSWLPPEEIPPAVGKPRLGKLLGMVGDRLREREDDPYRILAELPASIYVTTNFDPLLERALKANDRAPQQVATRWRHKRAPAVATVESFDEPTAKLPLVYHVFGAFGPDSEHGLVLTEDDYFDYLIANVAARLIPAEVESALVNNSLLFLGFRLTDWHFRVLFRLMMNLPGRERLKNYCHVAAQDDPDLRNMADVEGAKAYLAEYFGQEANIDIYWGSSEDFLVALRNELATGDVRVGELGKEEVDEWSF